MSLWQFNAATGGVVKANTPEDERGLSTAEVKALSAIIDAPPVWQ